MRHHLVRLSPMLWLVLVAGATIAAPASAQDLAPKGPWRVERSRIGDTTVVRTVAGSIWGGVARLTEELRIGALDGEPEYTLGRPSCILPLEDGGIWLFDGSVPALRRYDAAGKHLQTLGRDGAGPGEFRDLCSGLHVDAAGVLSMYDTRNNRLNRYAADGTNLPAVRSPGRIASARGLIADRAGRLRVMTTLRPPTLEQEGRYAFLSILPVGSSPDTLRFPELAGRENDNAEYGPRKVVAWSPLGYFVAGFSERYAINLYRGPGDVLRIEREAPRVRVGAREKSETMARKEEAYRTDKHHPPPEVVDPKAPYWLITPGEDGRIWVRLHTPSRRGEIPGRISFTYPPEPVIGWYEDVVYDVFEPDGRYLGQVVMPPKTFLGAARGDHLWAIGLGPMDEPYVVRYRISAR